MLRVKAGEANARDGKRSAPETHIAKRFADGGEDSPPVPAASGTPAYREIAPSPSEVVLLTVVTV